MIFPVLFYVSIYPVLFLEENDRNCMDKLLAWLFYKFISLEKKKVVS